MKRFVILKDVGGVEIGKMKNRVCEVTVSPDNTELAPSSTCHAMQQMPQSPPTRTDLRQVRCIA